MDGRVRVNRKRVTELGTKADPATDLIEVDGKPLNTSGPRRYILLNKPKSYISSASDPEGRPVVTDLVKRIKVRLYPVGRLDYDAEGALLLTNDGELSAKLLHPRHKVPKTYLVKVKGMPGEEILAKVRRGVRLEDGKTLPAKARLHKTTKENTWIEVTVTEGRNRLIKRIFAALGHPVLKLKRNSFAGLTPKGLKPGDYRELKPREVERLRTASGLDKPKPKPKPQKLKTGKRRA